MVATMNGRAGEGVQNKDEWNARHDRTGSHCRCSDPALDEALHQIEVLRQYLSDDLLLRLSIEHEWGHEPNNPQGVWCCDEHREAFHNGRLYG